MTGKYRIHPTYIQEMLADCRYSEEDIFSVIEYLRVEGAKSFSVDTLDAARHFYQGEARGSWSPVKLFGGREVVLLGTGPGVVRHRLAIERYIRKCCPLVVALNTQSAIDAAMINVRVACHPVRLLADHEAHEKLPQPLITPVSQLPTHIKEKLEGKELLDFGLGIAEGTFVFETLYCVLPAALVVAYALAIATSGKASRILMAGFDGYSSDDSRAQEMEKILEVYLRQDDSIDLVAVTPTRYSLSKESIYSF